MFDRDAMFYAHRGIDIGRDISSRRGRNYIRWKRALDIALTVLAAPFALVVIGAVAPLVRLDGGQVFLRQPRVGKDGKLFKLWKIRTMQPDAEQCLQKYLDGNPCAREEWDSHQKLRNDPRITPIGRYLRKYSIDELPQLLNILRGEMSLVGPRPMLPEQRVHYPGKAYFTLRPGLTGLWQVGDRNACSFADRAIYDDRYLEMISVSVDFRILLATPLVVFRGNGV